MTAIARWCRTWMLPLLLASVASFPAEAAPVVKPPTGRAAAVSPSGQRNPVIFATAFPVGGFASTTSPFALQRTTLPAAGRGGDLMVVYADGTLRNLTAEAGYGSTGANGFQDQNAIAVRDPAVSWDGTKAIFSMVIGAPAKQYTSGSWYWQLYEVTGLGKGEHAVITRVAHQPADFNNIMPTYGSGGAIIFVSDRPRDGDRALYPQLDEYESTPTVTGLWKLDRDWNLMQLVDAPSGDFHPRVDGYGRIVFTEWNHLQRDQQCDTPAAARKHGCRDYASEAADAATTTNIVEVYPERRIGADRSQINNHTFNLFLPWTVNQDGTAMETLDHVGRHELEGFFNHSFNGDANIRDYTAPNTPTRLENCHQIEPVASEAGAYLCIDAPEFQTQAAGAIVKLRLPQGAHADQQPPPQFLTRKVNNHQYDGAVPAGFIGHARDPIELADGTIVAAFDATAASFRSGDPAHPTPNYHFRLMAFAPAADGYLVPSSQLTSGIVKTISWFDPNVRVTYTGPLWELQPAEVVAKPEPPLATTPMEAPEVAAYRAAGVDPKVLGAWMAAHDVGLVVSRNVTSRDAADHQQPYNLRVQGGGRDPRRKGQGLRHCHVPDFRGRRGARQRRPGRTPQARATDGVAGGCRCGGVFKGRHDRDRAGRQRGLVRAGAPGADMGNRRPGGESRRARALLVDRPAR